MFIFLQKILPKKALSFAVGAVSRLTLGPFTNWTIRLYISIYKVDMSDSKIQNLSDFHTFNQFFTRELMESARSQPNDKNKISSPVDGTISQCGHIKSETLIQAKGRGYTLKNLLGDNELAHIFLNGTFHTIYLAPYNYHRVHMPMNGATCFLRYCPGHLFSVNKKTVAGIANLFCVNERASIIYKNSKGYFGIVMVGALNVGGIQLDTELKEDFYNRPINNLIPHTTHLFKGAMKSRGSELGRFNMGSTIILLTSNNLASWDHFNSPGTTIRVGDYLGGHLN